MFIKLILILFWNTDLRNCNNLKKSNVSKFELALELEFVFELVVSFRQCKDVVRKKRYSVFSYLLSVVNICKRL